jgi:ATP-dependent Clp protease protease subunit
MAKVNIKGVIISNDYQEVYDWMGYEATSPKVVERALQDANGAPVDVEINSGGGDVFSGSEIYTKLKDYSGDVTVKIVGLAASAASVIAMAGKMVQMSPTAQMMIHNVSSHGSGDYRDMAHAAEVLENANQTIANAYQIKTGIAQEELLAMMDKETWLTAQQAKEKGFIDEIMFENTVQFAASANNGMLPNDLLNKIKNMLAENPAQNDEADILIRQKAEMNEKELHIMEVLQNG